AETDPTRSFALAIGHARTLERLAQRGHAAHLEPGTVEIGEARRGHDGSLESKPLRLTEPCGHALHAAQLAAQAELAHEDRPRIGRAVAQRRRDRHRERQVGPGLADAQPADKVYVDVMTPRGEPRALRDHRQAEE